MDTHYTAIQPWLRAPYKAHLQQEREKPLLFLDVDGVISLFGFSEGYGLASGDAPFSECPPGRLHSINGVMHYISSDCGVRLRRLAGRYELV
jgi:hypothetical protein